MVNGLFILSLFFVAQAPAPNSPTDAAVQEALTTEGYSWYDSDRDALEPIQPPWKSSVLKRIGDWLDRLNFKWKGPSGFRFDFGRFIVIVLFLVALTLLLIALYYAYRAYAPSARAATVGATVGKASQISGLPAGLQVDLTDPLGEAGRLRASGDYAAATILLFVHLLLRLQETQQIRLAPGKTGRQLVRSITDPTIRTTVEPTLRLFEASYYGHRVPSESAFEDAWSQAERLEARFTGKESGT